ncbi:MAG: sugar ABC transporter permease [Bacillales bacterium]|nr:sugar ABC transporter permease [Bacillales bacterium]MDY6003005.1 sugar ABC transporter permease [Bacilli bacterium]
MEQAKKKKQFSILPKNKTTEEKVSGLICIAPAFILLTIFVLVPLVMAIWRSFYYYESGPVDSYFVGFENYKAILKNEIFLKSLGNVLLMALCIVSFQVIGSFIFASILVKVRNKFTVFVRVIIYLPYLFSGIVVGCIFTLLTTYNGGFINGLITLFDGEPISFQMDKFWAYLSIIVPTLWVGMGYTTLVFYSGLINIPNDYLEAASVDGAGYFTKLFSIILPSLKNYFVLIIVTLVTGNLQMFEIPMMMTNGLPLNMTMTPVLYLVHLRSNGNVSESQIIAASILIMLSVGAINAIVFSLTNRKDKDERRVKKHG